jgi:sugar transferase (PEP-CTERM system associated)
MRIWGHYVAISWLFLGVVEILLIGAGCSAAFYYHHSSAATASPLGTAVLATVLSFGVIALMHSGGLYNDSEVLDLRRVFWRIGAITAPVFLLALVTTGALARHTGFPIYPYRFQWTVLLTAGWLFSALSLRLLLRGVYRTGALTRRVLVVGTPARAAELTNLARQSHERFEVVAHFDPGLKGNEQTPHRALATLALRERATEVVFEIGDEPLPWYLLVHCRLSGIRVTDFLDFCERETRQVRLDGLREDWIVLSRGFGNTRSGERLRRVSDVLLALVGFVATAPVLFLTALAIKLEDGGPVFYRQERVGLEGRPFMLFKFRSMRENSERDGTPSWASVRDIRITGIGRVIRKVRIDELPQLWNVLRGEMTLVGPRPERPYFVHQFSHEIPFYDYRHAVRPGITGWAQVSFRYGASLDDTRRKLSYDLYYVRNRSLLLDIIILLRTVVVVLRGEGAR